MTGVDGVMGVGGACRLTLGDEFWLEGEFWVGGEFYEGGTFSAAGCWLLMGGVPPIVLPSSSCTSESAIYPDLGNTARWLGTQDSMALYASWSN